MAPTGSRVPHPDQVVDHGRGGVGGVVPALEGGDHHGVDQVRRCPRSRSRFKPSQPGATGAADHVRGFPRPAPGSDTIAGSCHHARRTVHVPDAVPTLADQYARERTAVPESHAATGRHRGAHPRPARADPGARRRHGHDDPAATGPTRRATAASASPTGRSDVKGNNDLLNADPAGRSSRDDPPRSTSRPAPTSSRPTPSTRTAIAQADYGLEELAYELNVAAARAGARRPRDE